jgi:4-hydroxyphenylacetate 3-hydroxylase, reductase component
MIPQEPDLDAPPGAKPPSKLDPREFRSHLGCFATGVTIITALGGRGQMLGVTANSFNSVSLDPPLVLFSLDRRAYSLWNFLSTGHFAVNVLAENQHELSDRRSCDLRG